MGKLIRASALVLLLAYSASAGVMMNGVYDPPPPPPSQSLRQETQGIQEPAAADQGMVAEAEPEVLLLVRVALDLFALL